MKTKFACGKMQYRYIYFFNSINKLLPSSSLLPRLSDLQSLFISV